MPSTVIAVRACTGSGESHIVSETRVLGMVRHDDGSVSVYCIEHAAQFDHATRYATLEIPLQM